MNTLAIVYIASRGKESAKDYICSYVVRSLYNKMRALLLILCRVSRLFLCFLCS